MKRKSLVFCSFLIVLLLTIPAISPAKDNVLSIDHYVTHTSTVPAIGGETVKIYVRERVLAGVAKKFASIKANGKVVLFVHGYTTPAEVVYDLSYKDYSWMEYLAQAGFDVFCMDITGYSNSTRPWPMDDQCNLSAAHQAIIGIDPPCDPSYAFQINTSQSEWDDIDSVVDYILEMRGVDKLSLVGWSLGGPRAGGYAGLYPEKVDKLILLAPVFSMPQPSEVPAPGTALNMTYKDGLATSWFETCEDQREPEIFDIVWDNILATDPVGATWGPGVSRTPHVTWWWDATMVQAPTLIYFGELDGLGFYKDIIYNEIANDNKVLMTFECTSHFAAFEWPHNILHKTSKDWLLHQSVKGMKRGSIHVDFDGNYTKYPE